eukprot:TRINITY_DN8653_c0_g1_i4.p2 TRINITY_DN8653_c0_g1~~TRINITY_DN8653_c0_g1_i4.p2  ORF type:complete len:498 (+),score=146.51 TRINITY_DN8653_c0_g1_i4:120-1613(+)
MAFLVDKLVEIVPDFKDIVEIFNDMVAQHHEDTAHIEDTRKTPFPILLGVLYRYQQRTFGDELEEHAEKQEDLKDEIEEVCRKYWVQTRTIGHTIRKGVSSSTPETLDGICEENKNALIAELGLAEEDLIKIWVSELQNEEQCGLIGEGEVVPASGPSLASHCPDFTITIDREQKAVVVTLLGTRIFPTPNIHDVIMDLRGETVPFLTGVGHAGMVIGTRNILEKSFPSVLEALENNPGLSVLVVGYSLGAGLAQLYTAQLLEGEYSDQIPEGTKIRALCYGAPPVFRCEEEKIFDEIMIVQNDKDGVISASIKTINDLFNKAVAIDAADIDQQVMVNMLLEKNKKDEAENSNEDIVDPQDKTRDEETVENPRPSNIWSLGNFLTTVSRSYNHYRETIEVDPAEWEKVREALETRKVDHSQHMTLLGKTVLQMKNIGGNLTIKKYTGLEATNKFSQEIRLSKKMFGHHMPWGYSALFQTEAAENNRCAPDIGCFDFV